ncbi:CRISPR-associated endonuclease Cas2 [Lacticaseibacillus daqingensis]|uniref:CRISPR-associated endonuclease Cas2 n=1 Tax=Lacticaseibacillus daqingensis TaxID=2486014 RepID=UPI000F7AD1DC|nr:CRISPR-associated endonuclease Cas2 [Lacticaseibacillus daqingensis]
MIVVVYDIAITSPKGSRRLARVAKLCGRYGQRVQNSVFECLIDNLQFHQLQHEMLAIIDPDLDSVRYYQLGKQYANKIRHVGTREVEPLDHAIIL